MYYQGDYYQGDYYQGDPFIGALLGGAVSWLGKKLFKRGLSKPAQAAAGTAMMRGTGRFATQVALPAAAGAAAMGALSNVPLPGPFRMNVPGIFPGGAPFIRREVSAPRVGTAGGCCPSGFHLNKQESHGRQTHGQPAGSFCVRNRSMNVANPRALRRSLRRVGGFGKLAQRAKKDIRRASKAIGA